MVMRLGRVKPPVFPFPLKRHEKKQFPFRAQQPPHFLQRRRWLHDVLQGMMANGRVHCGAGNRLRVGNKFNARAADGGREKISQIEGELAPAIKALIDSYRAAEEKANSCKRKLRKLLSIEVG